MASCSSSLSVAPTTDTCKGRPWLSNLPVSYSISVLAEPLLVSDTTLLLLYKNKNPQNIIDTTGTKGDKRLATPLSLCQQ